MPEAWIQFLCPECRADWEANPADLPDPSVDFECDHCGTTRPLAEFARTDRDFEILEEFHAA